MNNETITRIYRAYRNNFVGNLVAFSKDFGQRAFEYLKRERGHHAIRPIYLHILSMIPAEGIRLSQLANLLDMNVQHCMDLLNEFEAAGYVRRTEDPLDSRARLVHLTKRGKSLVYDSIDFGKTQDPHYQNLMTPERFTQFEQLCDELNDRMGFSGMRSRQYPEYLDKTGSQLYGHLFQSEAYAQRFIHRHLEACGHTSLKESTNWLVGRIGIGGAGIAKIAKLRGISVQATGRIIKEAEAAGYVKSLPDPTDRRRKTLLVTERGLELLADTVDALNQLEKEFSKVLGAEKFQLFQRELSVFCGRNPDESATAGAQDAQPVLFYQQSEQRAVHLDDAPINRLELLLYVAHLLDLDHTGNEHATLTQLISTSIHGENLLMLTPSTLDALNIARLSLDTIGAKLHKQFGKKTAQKLAGVIDHLKVAL